jgi:hypothetical protein
LRGSQFEASLGKKFVKPHLNQWLGVVAHACYPSYVGSVNRRLTVQACPSLKQQPVSEITEMKSAGGMAQVVEPSRQAQGP